MKKFLLLSCIGSLAFFASLNAQTTTFNYTGGMQTYTVPPGVVLIQLETWGAQGGAGLSGNGNVGGLGGYAKGNMTVTPGQVLNVYVGGQGSSVNNFVFGGAGYNGGGNANGSSTGGGGASDVRVSPYALANRVIVAGGGGGNGYYSFPGGAGGGLTGTAGGNTTNGSAAYGGGGGTQAAGGTSSGTYPGTSGSLGVGGDGGIGPGLIGYSGGGGGGYYGGGGGGGDVVWGDGYGAGGGGGSSYTGSLASPTNTAGIQTGNGAAAITVLTVAGAALNFDGINDYVDCGNSPSLQITGNAITLEAWVYVTAWAGSFNDGSIINKEQNSPDNGYMLRCGNNGTVSFNIGIAGTWHEIISPSSSFPLSTWTHICGTYNGAVQNLYINGVLVATQATSGNIGNSAVNLYLGNSQNNPSRLLTGSIDEVRIWNRGLCQSEISNNRNCEIPTTGSGLVANYHFNQGISGGSNPGVTTLTDASASANNGTLNNFGLNGATSNWIAPGGVVSGSSCGAFVPPAVTVTPLSQTNVSCFSGASGAASVTASGGSGLTYNWTPGNPTGDGTASVTGLTAGSWTCTVTNSCGGTGTAIFTVTQPSALSITAASQTNISCFGGNSGAASVNNATGGAGPYTYNWTPGNPTGDGTVSVTGLTAGSWTCTVTDANSCTSAQVFTLTQPSALTLTAASQTNVSCFGGSNGSATVNAASGGTPGYTYNWTPSGGTGLTASGLTFGTYTCTATDANGCTSTQTFNITQPATAVVATSSATSIACNGGTSTVTVVASGGTSPYTGDGAFTVSAGGPYSYTVTDNNGCTSTTTITVTEPTLLATTSSATSIACNGGTSTVTVVASGGTSPYTGDGGFTETAGTYSYTVTDNNGCTSTTTITVTEPAVLTATLTSASNPTSCSGTDGAVDITVTGGTTAYTFLWSNAATTEDLGAVAAGTYSCTITDANGCTATVSASISDPNGPTASATSTSILCNGGTSTVTVVATGGTTPYTGDGLFTEFAGTYSYNVTDANGCSSTATITLTEPTAIAVTSTSTSVLCNGGTADVTITATGGTSPYTGEGMFTDTSGTYSYIITDANGCMDSVSVTVTEPTALVATIVSSTNPSACGATDGAIDMMIAGGTPGYTFLWSTTDTTEDVSNLAAGSYNCTVTDTNGCTTQIGATLNDPNAPVVTMSVASTICLDDAALTLSGTPAGGTYAGTGVTGNTFDPMVAGNGAQIITYTFTDSLGCTGIVSDTISVDPCTGIATSTPETIFSVYPNPNNGTFTFVSNSSADVMIYNAIGQLVNSFKAEAGENQQLYLENAGMYTITIITAEGTRTSQRVIVSK
ncbi:hypothetical protein BH09BAC5_BH09BAC5_02230 [soil metagenome]